MAYTIQFLDASFEKRDQILVYINQRLIKDGRFTANLQPTIEKRLPAIRVKPVRLTKPKPYCGNHPGPCEVNPFIAGPQKKMRARFLEWNDWVKFHKIINSALNRFRANANVWSTPADTRGKMWIRKNTKPRLRYDYTEAFSSTGRPNRIWNQGTDDQFVP